MAENTEDTITVAVANPPRGTFFEKSDRHPHGEAWVRGRKKAKVAKTRAVLAAIAEGRIVTVDKEALDDAEPDTIEAEAQEATSEAETTNEGEDATPPDSEAQTANDADSGASQDKDVVRTDAGVPNVLTDRPVTPTPRPANKPNRK